MGTPVHPPPGMPTPDDPEPDRAALARESARMLSPPGAGMGPAERDQRTAGEQGSGDAGGEEAQASAVRHLCRLVGTRVRYRFPWMGGRE